MYLKIKFNRVIKCVSCLITCSMLVVAGMFTPVNATNILAGNYDPADYIDNISLSGDNKIVTYDLSDIPYMFRFWDNDTLTITDYQGHFEVQLPPDLTQYVVASYPLGVVGNTSSLNGGALYVGDLLPGSAIDFDFTLYLSFRWDNRGSPFSITLAYEPFYMLYDASGNYLDTVSLDATTDILQLDHTSTYLSVTPSICGVIPADSSYIIPCVRVRIMHDASEPLACDFFTSGSSVQFQVDINTILENSNQMHEINNKLDSIISGTPEQNENANNSADTVEDQKDQIGDLVDQMSPSRPNTDHIDTDISAIAGDQATALFSDGMSGILNHPLILSMLSIVAVVSFIGYVLFGKVG